MRDLRGLFERAVSWERARGWIVAPALESYLFLVVSRYQNQAFSVPKPGFHRSQWRTTGEAEIKPFQKGEARFSSREGFLNQWRRGREQRYLSNMTFCQTLLWVSALQNEQAKSAELKKDRFFKPQPPAFRGLYKVCHLQRWMWWLSTRSFQRNLQDSLRSKVITLLGIRRCPLLG